MIFDQCPIEASAGAAVAIVEQQPIAAAARQRLAADAERRPDLADGGKLAPQRADIFDVLASVQLHGVQVEQCRDVADDLERRVAEHADRPHPEAAGGTGQRRSLVCRDMAGAARHEDEAGERRWPGGAHVGAAVQAAQFGAAEDRARAPLERGRQRASATSRSRKHRRAVRSRSMSPGCRNAGLGDEQAVRRQTARAARSSRGRSLRSRRSRLLMPISGAPSARARRISASSWTSTSASMPKRRASAIIARAARRRAATA